MSETSDSEPAPKGHGVATAKAGRDRLLELPDADIFAFGPVAPKPTAPNQSGKPAVELVDVAVQSPMRDGMFDRLVAAEDDVLGLVAYGIYKHSKRDWLAAFGQVHGRAPDAGEVRSFILGETTSRRIATYRHLAENMVAATYARVETTERKTKPLSPAAAAPPRERHARVPATASRLPPERRRPSLLIIAYLAVLILFLVGLLVFVRNGLLPFGLGSR